MKRPNLPILQNLRVASPCTADWNAMTPVDVTTRVRHCGDCDKDVYNLSGMTRAEAEALLVATRGNLCARYYQRKDGTILLADCTVGVAASRKRKLVAAGAVALLAGGAASTFASHHEHRDVAATIVDHHAVEDIRFDERGMPETAHDDPPPPAPPAELSSEPDEDHNWHALKGKVAIDHFEADEVVK